MKTLWCLVLSTLSISAWSATANPPAEAKTYKLRWVLAHEPIKVFARAAAHFAEEVKKESGGHVQIEVINGRDYNHGKSMSADQAFELVKAGKIEMTQTYTTYLGNHSAPFWALDLPFLFRNHEHASHVLQGPVGNNILAGLQASNIQGLAFTYSGGYMIIPTAHQEIKSIEDFKGLKVKINNDSPVGTALMKSLGAIPVTSPVGSNDLDGFETTYVRFVELKNDVQSKDTVINDLQHSLFLTAILINKDFFTSMPKDYQAAIQRAARSAALLEREDSIRDGIATREQVEKRGFKVVTMAPEQMKRFKESVGPVYQKFEPMLGKDLIESIQKQ